MTNTRNKIAVVTGASSGIGKEVAKALAAQGWDVIGTGRDHGRMAAAEREICSAATTGRVEMVSADLARMAGAERAADAIAALTDRIDLLVNNAGSLASEKKWTDEGLEENFAGNHFGPFLLTQRLLPLLQTAARGTAPGTVRILNTSSIAGEMIPTIDINDMRDCAQISTSNIYCAGKLANLLFTRTLAERLERDGITVHAVHPGPVASNFFASAPAETVEALKDYKLCTEVEGADTLIWLATAAEGGASTGGYWFEREPRAYPAVAEDSDYRERFWAASDAIISETLGRAA